MIMEEYNKPIDIIEPQKPHNPTMKQNKGAKMSTQILDKTYIVTKEGVYGHGCFYITSDKQEAINEAKRFAMGDKDDYHSWMVYEFREQTDPKDDAQHIEVFETDKFMARASVYSDVVERLTFYIFQRYKRRDALLDDMGIKDFIRSRLKEYENLEGIDLTSAKGREFVYKILGEVVSFVESKGV